MGEMRCVHELGKESIVNPQWRIVVIVVGVALNPSDVHYRMGHSASGS